MTDSNQTETVFAIGRWSTDVNERLDKMDAEIARLEALQKIPNELKAVWGRLDRISSSLLMLEHSKLNEEEPAFEDERRKCSGCDMPRRSPVEIDAEAGCLYCRMYRNMDGPGSSVVVQMSPTGFLNVRPVDPPPDDDRDLVFRA